MTSKVIIIVCWAFITVCISSCTRSIPIPAASPLITPTMTSQTIRPKSTPLFFEMSSAKDTFQIRESVPITLSLTNTSSENLVIKNSWTDTVPPEETLGEMRIIVTDTLEIQEGSVAIITLEPPADEPKKVIALAPDEAYSLRVDDARRFFVFKSGHQYLIQATYRHDSPEGWQGELKSDPILITIQ